MNLPRIYADFNGYRTSPRDKTRHVVPLDTYGSWNYLSNAGIRLADGMKLIIFSDSDEFEDLESNVTVYWDKRAKKWMAELDKEGYRYVPLREEDRKEKIFHCYFCQAPLDDFIHIHGLNPKTHCPLCNHLLFTPIAPPDIRKIK